jgi:TPR repeat protein
MPKALLFLLFLFVSISSYGQSDCEKCKLAFDAKDFSKAKEVCLAAAKAGSADCQAYLGIIYLSESDLSNARKWFEQSALQGNASAQNGLGYLYQNGLGDLSKDIAKANEWFLKSANQGNSDSQFWLGENLYLSGNKKEAFQWTQKASFNGSTDAQFNLGVMYLNGEGVSKDESLGVAWLIISATNGKDKAKEFIDLLRPKLPKDQFQIFIRKAEELTKQNPMAIK